MEIFSKQKFFAQGNAMTEAIKTASPFTHLHVHSEYSLMDGAIVIKELIKRAKDRGHSHIALTDHSNMHGAIEFYQTAKSAGITPIIGCEIYCPGVTQHSWSKEKQGNQTRRPGDHGTDRDCVARATSE